MPTAKQLANLRPPFQPGEDARTNARLGGIASGKKRRELKEIRLWAEQNLFSARGQDKKPLYEMLFKKLEQLSAQGNLKAIEMLMNYSGLKPIDKVENLNPTPIVVNNDISIDKLKEIKDKLNNNE